MSDDRTRSDPAYFALVDALRIANLRLEELEHDAHMWRTHTGNDMEARIAELEAALREVERMLDGTDHDERLRVIARTALDGKGSDPTPTPSVPERDGNVPITLADISPETGHYGTAVVEETVPIPCPDCKEES